MKIKQARRAVYKTVRAPEYDDLQFQPVMKGKPHEPEYQCPGRAVVREQRPKTQISPAREKTVVRAAVQKALPVIQQAESAVAMEAVCERQSVDDRKATLREKRVEWNRHSIQDLTIAELFDVK